MMTVPKPDTLQSRDGDIETLPHQEAEESAPPPSSFDRYRSRLRSEFSMGFFQHEDFDGRILDMKSSFGVYQDRRKYLLIGVRSFFLGLLVYDFVASWLDREAPIWYMAYLSHWSLFYAIVYLSLSLFISFDLCTSDRLFHATWIVFSVTFPHEAGVLLLFWPLSYDPNIHDLDYDNIMTHGGALVLVLVDGMILSRVPVRLKHLSVTLVFALLYSIWTILQNIVLQQGPEDSTNDDDALYDVLKWRKTPLAASMLCVTILALLFPLLYLLGWLLSLPRRRYLSK